MLQRDYRDIVAGSVLCLLGAFVALYCAIHYNLGSLTKLGPGLFPAALGVFLAVMGAAIAGLALFRQGQKVTVEVRPAVAVLVSLAAFAMTIESFGLIPAISLLTFVASFGNDRLRLSRAVGLAVALSAIATLIFRVGLELPVDAVRWPF